MLPLLAAAWVVMGAQPAPGSNDHTEPPGFIAQLATSTLSVEGHASSTAHESILRDTVRRYFSDRGHLRTSIALRWDVPTPPGWALVTDIALRALSTTQSASVEVTPERVFVRGITASPEEWDKAVGRIEAALLEGMQLTHEVVVVSGQTAYPQSCHHQLSELSASTVIDFVSSSSELATGAAPQLDAIVELSVECGFLVLEVTGHTDASGSEDLNVALSRARAESVVDYLVTRGLARDRLIADGVGSAEPIATGSGRRARRQNRRVEFRFLEP